MALTLLPQPRSLTLSDGEYSLAAGRRIVLQAEDASALLFVGQRLQAALARAGIAWEISATAAGSADGIGAVLRLAPEKIVNPQGYALAIAADGIVAEAQTPAGLFYAVCTLIQVIEQAGVQLPYLTIVDWPDFAARGVMLDISRDKVPTLETVLELVDMLAGWKINQIQLYTEHTFSYRDHPEVWANASPFTGQEILVLDAYCRARFVELVPHFSSRMFNVGCDETVDLGQGRSKEICEQRGTGRVYLDFLQKIYADVKARGRTMQFWGDIIVEYPDLIPELPKDAIALEWGYEASHPFAEHCPRFAAAGLPFYVCPGTSSWNCIGGRTDNALGNLRNAAENDLKSGALGYLITDWGDRGHWQTLPISYLGFAAGAAYAWAVEASRDLDVARVVSLHAFRDITGAMGRVAYDLGNVYRILPEIHNSSPLFWLLQFPAAELTQPRDPLAQALVPRIIQALTSETFDRALKAIDKAVEPLEEHRMSRPDAELIQREFASAAQLLRHACRRASAILDGSLADGGARGALDQDIQALIAEYRQLWLARNRPGGLEDSAGRLERARADYSREL